jgi:hypothetical protein
LEIIKLKLGLTSTDWCPFMKRSLGHIHIVRRAYDDRKKVALYKPRTEAL